MTELEGLNRGIKETSAGGLPVRGYANLRQKIRRTGQVEKMGFPKGLVNLTNLGNSRQKSGAALFVKSNFGELSCIERSPD
jgi:hypothetical protein